MTLSAKFEQLRSYARRDGAGVGVSILLHAGILLLILFLARHAMHEQPAYQAFVPVSLVAQSEGPNPEPKQQKAAGVISKTPLILPRAPVAHHTPSGVAPNKTTQPVDELQMQLKALSKLRQPNTDTRVFGEAGQSDIAQDGNDDESGGQGPYHTRDIIRAQVLRRWSLDMTRLGNRNFDILIHVLLKRDGTVLEADIVDTQRFKTDSVFRWIALSAKNAVILSSPLTLPPDMDKGNLDLTLRLNPRDTME
ncbi:MAG TPA: hypothetical protein VMD53_18495 [Rhizomicrobium sp.]|nr:hypothetical protein [Rhizomicrobium sp.]